MGKRKIFTICFLVFVVGVIAIAMIIAGCDKNTVRDTTTSSDSSSFDKSILETNSSKTIKNLEVPINDKWEVENNKDDSIYENDYCYTIDGNNGYIFMWVRSRKVIFHLNHLRIISTMIVIIKTNILKCLKYLMV